MIDPKTYTGTVISVTRRHVQILTDDKETIRTKLTSPPPRITVGDTVLLKSGSESQPIGSINPRKNCLSRTYRKKTREIAANIDLLLVVTAVAPLFNTVFVDRILTVAALSQIPSALVFNKTDLGEDSTRKLIEIYKDLKFNIIFTSAIGEGGLVELVKILHDPNLHTIVLAGISGVGKSTILNKLVPEARRPTSTVSRKTGLGRQTTSLSVGYRYPRCDMSDLLIIDLPGIQNFGVSNFSIADIANSFSEFNLIKQQCEYLDCLHLAEPNCAVKDAVKDNKIALSRYESYLNMTQEIESAREY
jgi:ribosome biogenesis GTPase / thiamine phosphate phosphatase